MKLSERSEDYGERFNFAINEALLATRIALGKAQVCPVCFAGAMIETLTAIAGQYEHDVPISELTEAEIALFKAQIVMGEVLGTA